MTPDEVCLCLICVDIQEYFTPRYIDFDVQGYMVYPWVHEFLSMLAMGILEFFIFLSYIIIWGSQSNTKKEHFFKKFLIQAIFSF